jgi:hypothetical protein
MYGNKAWAFEKVYRLSIYNGNNRFCSFKTPCKAAGNVF